MCVKDPREMRAFSPESSFGISLWKEISSNKIPLLNRIFYWSFIDRQFVKELFIHLQKILIGYRLANRQVCFARMRHAAISEQAKSFALVSF